MSILVTGARGFVGSRLVDRLRDAGETVHALDHRGVLTRAGVRTHRVDIDDRPALDRLVAGIEPRIVYHLAAIANPRRCREDPRQALEVNAGGTAKLLDALRDHAPPGVRVLVASSSAVYGRPDGPLDETSPLRGRDAYAHSKRAAERFAQRCARAGLAVVVARPFNHSGPGQTTDYVLPAIAVEIVRSREEGRLPRTGNLHVRRDFLHVDDVLDAYEVLVGSGLPGRAYNVCSGVACPIGAMLEGLQERLDAPRGSVADPALVRPGEVEELVGRNERIRALGWHPRRSLARLLDDVAADAR